MRIEHRFRGPTTSGNGGYVAGCVAGLVDGPHVVELRSPPPLDTDLSVTRTEWGVEVHDGDTLVARALPAELPSMDPPDVPDLAEARSAVERYVGFEQHPFPECFVCGPDREHGDGLRIFPGLVAGSDVAASPWTPDASLAGPGGHVADEHVWAALDCPGYFGAAESRTAVLASMRVDQRRPVPVGETVVALGWRRDRSEGRKIFAGSALAAGDGTLLALAESLWIEIELPTA